MRQEFLTIFNPKDVRTVNIVISNCKIYVINSNCYPVEKITFLKQGMKKNKLKYLLLFSQLIISCYLSYGQYKIEGELREQDSENLVSFATVAIYSLPDSGLISGKISDSNGKFTFENLGTGKYMVKITFVGYLPKIISDITIEHQSLNLGIINLKSSFTRLSKAVIVAERPDIITNPGKTVVNVAKDITAQGATALEVLDLVPSVSVDADNKVTLRGSKPKILIDGVESDLTNLLDILPADEIESVEVITNPSAKYDVGEGDGVINIVLKNKRKSNVNGRLFLKMDNKGDHLLSANLNRNQKKFSFGGGVSLTNKSYYANEIKTKEVYKSNPYFLSQNADLENDATTRILNASFSYKPSNKFTLSAKGLYQTNTTEFSNNLYGLKTDSIDSEISHNKYYRGSKRNQEFWQYTIQGVKKFNKKQHEIVFLFQQSENQNRSMANKDNTTFHPDNSLKGEPSIEEQIFNTRNKFVLLKFDYSYPINNRSKLEAGYKGSYRDIWDDKLYLNFLSDSNLWEESHKSHIYLFDGWTNSIYLTYSLRYKKMFINLGVRNEYIISNPQPIGLEGYFQNTYFEIIPSFSIGYVLNANNSLNFSVSGRTKPPSYAKLNPFIVSNNDFYLRYGNPNLLPEKTTTLELSYKYAKNKFNILPSVFYRHITDIIGTSITIDENDVTHSTRQNLSSGSTAGLEFISSKRIGEKVNLKLSTLFFRTRFDLTNTSKPRIVENESFSVKFGGSARFAHNIKIQFNASYYSPVQNYDGRKYERLIASGAVKKDFFKNKLTMVFKVTDLFNTYYVKQSKTNHENLYTLSTTNYDRQRFSIGISYKFMKRI